LAAAAELRVGPISTAALLHYLAEASPKIDDFILATVIYPHNSEPYIIQHTVVSRQPMANFTVHIQ
jgi:hypothetical protein